MKNEAIQKRQDAEKKLVVEHLKKIPIIQLACDKSGISRPTYYRWRKDDEDFKKDSDEAMRDGKEMINDLSESQLIALIKDKNFHAIQLWLRQHHPEYGNRLEVKATIEKEDPLTPEQEALIREALGIQEVETEKAYEQPPQS
jgi:Helix-turn-helix of insertion element transposase